MWETDFQTNGSYKSDTNGNYYTSDSSSSKPQCEATPSKFNLPIQSEYLAQVFSQIGVKFWPKSLNSTQMIAVIIGWSYQNQKLM